MKRYIIYYIILLRLRLRLRPYYINIILYIILLYYIILYYTSRPVTTLVRLCEMTWRCSSADPWPSLGAAAASCLAAKGVLGCERPSTVCRTALSPFLSQALPRLGLCRLGSCNIDSQLIVASAMVFIFHSIPTGLRFYASWPLLLLLRLLVLLRPTLCRILNCKLVIAVVSAGPGQQALDCCGPCRTRSSGSDRVVTAGPRPRRIAKISSDSRQKECQTLD